jgi:hypothetical protein
MQRSVALVNIDMYICHKDNLRLREYLVALNICIMLTCKLAILAMKNVYRTQSDKAKQSRSSATFDVNLS